MQSVHGLLKILQEELTGVRLIFFPIFSEEWRQTVGYPCSGEAGFEWRYGFVCFVLRSVCMSYSTLIGCTLVPGQI